MRPHDAEITKAVMKNETPTSHETVLKAVGKTASPGDLSRFAIDGRAPRAVIFPDSVDQLRLALETAWQEGLTVAPYGGGTRTSLGKLLSRLDLVVDLTGLDGIVDYQPSDLTITLQAGITLSKLQESLQKHGQFLPIDAPLPGQATIGGTLASNAMGPLRWRNNSLRDLVIGMQVVQADGTATRSGGKVVKNVTGYDMSRLHIGALGTLGIITEVSFKLIPLHEREGTILSAFRSPEECFEAATAILRSHANLLSLTAMNPEAATIVAPGASEPASHALAVRVGGSASAVDRQVKDAVNLCKAAGARRVESISPPYSDSIWAAIRDMGYERDNPSVMSTRAVVLPSKAYELMQQTWSPEAVEPTASASLCHLTSGATHSHWFVGSSDLDDDVLVRTAARARQKARDLGGFLTVERCPPSMKGRMDVWDRPGDALDIMRRLKEEFDPKGILNPGRYVGGI